MFPFLVLSCSDDEETIEDRIKSSIIKSYGIENLIEFSPVKEVGKYEDSKMYKQIMAGNASGQIDGHTLTKEELVEYYREFHTTTMYNCFVKWEQDGYHLSYTFCVNSDEEVFAFDFKAIKID